MVNSEDPTVLGKLSQQTLSLWVFPGNFSWAVLGGPKIEVFFFHLFLFPWSFSQLQFDGSSGKFDNHSTPR